jgi:hypothetical protein
MTISITHSYVATGADEAGKEVNKAQWNAALITSMATARLIGRTTASAGAFEEISVGTGLSFSSLSLSFDQTYGDGRYARLAATNVFSDEQTIYSTTDAQWTLRSEGVLSGNYGSGFDLYTKAPDTTTNLGSAGAKGWSFRARSDNNNLTQQNDLFFAYWDGSAWSLPVQLSTATTTQITEYNLEIKKTLPRQLFRRSSGTVDYPGFEWYDSTTWKAAIYYIFASSKFVVYTGGSSTEYDLWHSGTLSKPVSVITLSGAPTTSNIPSGEARVVKRTDTGAVTLHYNDGGTLKSVTLT